MLGFYKNIPRKEGDSYDEQHYFVFGKCVKQTYEIIRLPDGTALDHDNMPDGWYFMINTTIKRYKRYLCANTYEEKEGICTPRLLFRIRKVGKRKWYSIFKAFAWKPLTTGTPVTEIRYDDPYLYAMKIKDKIED